jgi:uncharacterized membrane protein YeiH
MTILPLLPFAAIVAPPLAISLTAVFLGGLSGAIFAVQRKFAITGVLTIAIATGLGGGIIRDLLLGRTPVALTNPSYLPLVVGAAFVGFFFASLVHRGELVLNILDPIWMGLFAVIGATQAINAGLSSFAAILVGCISAFGGAVLRDLLAGETPQLVLPGPINYLAAILGAIIYVGMVNWAGIDKVVSEWVAIAIVFGLRMLALKYGIKAPEPVDVPHHVRRRVMSNWRARRRGIRLYRADGEAGSAAPGTPGPSFHDPGPPFADSGGDADEEH